MGGVGAQQQHHQCRQQQWSGVGICVSLTYDAART